MSGQVVVEAGQDVLRRAHPPVKVDWRGEREGRRYAEWASARAGSRRRR